MIKNLKCERISNGIIVFDGEEKRYYRGIREMMEHIIDELAEEYEETRHFEWDNKFTVKVNTKGLVSGRRS